MTHSTVLPRSPYSLKPGPLPPLTGFFDYVICADGVGTPARTIGIVEGVPALMSSDGMLVGSLPNSGHAWFRCNVLKGRFPQEERGPFDRTHLRFYTWDGWGDLFRRAGLRIEEVRTAGVPVGRYRSMDTMRHQAK